MDSLLISQVDMGNPVRPGRGAKALLVIGLLVVALVGIPAAAMLGFRWFLFPTTDDGTCFVFDRHECSALSQSRVEEIADVKIPAGADIIDSSARRGLKSGYQSALIRLAGSDTLGLGSGYLDEDARSAPLTVTAYLAKHGLHGVDSVHIDSQRGSTIYFLQDEDGVHWAYVWLFWNG